MYRFLIFFDFTKAEIQAAVTKSKMKSITAFVNEAVKKEIRRINGGEGKNDG